MRKIGIIGMGHVGSTLAHALLVQGMFDEYVLIDTNEKKVQADALDFQDAATHLPFSFQIKVNDYQALATADIVVSTLGKIELQDNPAADRFAELEYTKKEVKKVAQNLKDVAYQGLVVVVTNPVDVVTALYRHYLDFPYEKVIGTGTLLDTARMKRAVGNYFHLHPRSVKGYTLGEHGNSQFTAWSQVLVKGHKIQAQVADSVLLHLEKEILRGGHTVFYGKKYTSYGIASAALYLIQALLSDSQEELPVSHYVSDLDCYAGYPALVGRKGIVETVRLTLTSEEETKLAQSAAIIRQKFRKSIED